MDLEQLQNAWSQMSHQLEKQKKMTDTIILDMTREKYRNTFKTLTTFEIIGTMICLATGIHIAFNFLKLDTWYLIGCGVFTVAYLFIVPFLVLQALKKIRNINISSKNYRETLIAYSKAKKRLLKIQRFASYSSFILMFAVSAVFAKIWRNKDFFMLERDIWNYVVMVFALVFVSFFTWYGLKSYRGITNSAEKIIRELEDFK